jgi:hypothetical protein
MDFFQIIWDDEQHVTIYAREPNKGVVETMKIEFNKKELMAFLGIYKNLDLWIIVLKMFV